MDNFGSLSRTNLESLAAAVREARRRRLTIPTALRKPATPWPVQYRNRETGKLYQPHHEDERLFVYSDTPTNALAKGGEGGGKSVAGIIKDLERVRRGMSGIIVSPDLPHFKRSLWPEFKRWCPWEQVIETQQYRGRFDWEPQAPFQLAFKTGATLYCGGIEDPSAWEGPNVSFAHFDEARRARTANALKVLKGRVRIPGPHGEPPQFYVTTTPAKNWLFDYFGPLQPDDEQAAFKGSSLVVTLLTRDNEANLTPGFVQQRGQGLTEAEKRVLLEAEWEDVETAERFLPSITWWDACQEPLAPLDRNTPLVVGVDAGVTNDCFAVVGVSRHPTRPQDAVAVRLVRVWVPAGRALDFDTIEQEIRDQIIKPFNVKQLAYDKYQLHQMMTRLGRLAWAKEFSQAGDRLVADKQLLDLIQQRRLSHDGNRELRSHIEHADRKNEGDQGRLRIVKRSDNLKVDLAVALSMASAECLRLNLT